MGRAINNENDIDMLKKEMNEVRDAIAELHESIVDIEKSLMQTKSVKHVDLHDDGFMPPAGKPKKTTKKVKEVEKV
tara:strand:+ start:424 stop:651 length:228 start_codon:yes stop_codon:yes gene_type:complete